MKTRFKMTEERTWDCCQVAKKEVKTVALLGCTGRVGGWVLEMALERGHTVQALVRTPEKVDEFSNYEQMEKLHVIQGGIDNKNKMRELVKGVDVVISTLGSPSKNNLIMTTAAETLVQVLSHMTNPPRHVKILAFPVL